MPDSTSTDRRLERPRATLGLAVGMFTVAASIGFGSLYAMGVPFLGQDPVAVAEPEPEVMLPVVSTKQTEAERVLSALIENPGSKWVPRGTSIRQASSPLPYSCPASDTSAALSIGHAYMVGGSSVQVVATAYGAGLGAEALQTMSKRAYSCASGRAALSHWAESGVGAQSFSSIAGATRTTALRRGDVILFVTGGTQVPTKALALQLDQRLMELATKACTNPDSKPADASRNLFSAGGYEPYRVNKNLKVKDPGLPELEPDAAYTAMDLREPVPAAPPVATPAQQPVWPVWPLMPEPVELPKAPEAPSQVAPTTGSIKVLAPDKHGPGCGWDFTGSVAPIFDAPAAERENAAATNAKLTELTTLAGQWQDQVLAFWSDVHDYGEARAAYEKYSKAVAEVNKAWGLIAEQWDRYNRDKTNWDARVQAAEELRTKQEAARGTHENQLAQCKADNDAYVPPVEPAPDPTVPGTPPAAPPMPTATPDAETDTEPGNAPPPTYPVDCQAAFPAPAILELTPVDPGPEPEKPADPRPANEMPPVEEPAA